MMNELKLNIACGPIFIENSIWTNADYDDSYSSVQRVDLLSGLPYGNEEFSLVYSSHFLEHIPRGEVNKFLEECFRVLKPGGLIRLVLPDFEEMSEEYLFRRKNGDHKKADLLVIEIIDQCVRMRPGGELKALYDSLIANPEANADMINYLYLRNGENLGVIDRVIYHENKDKNISVLAMKGTLRDKIARRFERLNSYFDKLWFNWLINRLPSAFRMQNVSLSSIGERHHWLWDFYQLSSVLLMCGFKDVQKASASVSLDQDFPFFPLDLDVNGKPRKGAESMYVEAVKPY